MVQSLRDLAIALLYFIHYNREYMRYIILVLLLLTTFLGGCTSADRAKLFALGSKHKITLYSGGVAVRTWHSSGAISNEEKSDGYYFQDDETGKLISVSGQIVIEQE